MTKIKIKRAKQISLSDCRRLILDSEPWKTLGYGERHVRLICRDSHKSNILVALQGKSIVGFIISKSGFLLGNYLKLLVVDGCCRGLGVGKKLMKEFEKQCFAKSKNIYICVSDFNRPAQKFYRQLGYKKVGLLKDLLVRGSDEILLRKTKTK